MDARRRPDGQVRPGAWVAELTGMLDLTGWPKGMRLTVRKERAHPGAQLRFTDIGTPLHLLCHQHHAGSDRRPGATQPPPRPMRRRIRAAMETGLCNLPLHDFTQNQIWVEIAALACELIAWMQMARSSV
ncbi:transposase [Microbispora hainanensis]